MSFTFTTLRNAIKDYAENQETTFVSHIPDYIKSAEERIFKTVDLEFFRKNVSGTTSSSNQFLAVPEDYLASFSLSITKNSLKEFLSQKDVNYVQQYNPNTTITGTPKYYAIFDTDNFILAPTPDASYVAELHYYFRPASLTASKTTLVVSSVSGTFTEADTLTGGTSGAISKINFITTTTNFNVVIPPIDFTVGETLTGSSSGATGVVVSTTVDSAQTWLSENAPNAMLYGSLLEAYTFMKGEADVMKLYNDRFLESLSRLKDYAEARENSDAYRRGLPQRART